MPRSIVDRVLNAFLELTDDEISEFAGRLFARDGETARLLKAELAEPRLQQGMSRNI